VPQDQTCTGFLIYAEEVQFLADSPVITAFNVKKWKCRRENRFIACSQVAMRSNWLSTWVRGYNWSLI